MITVQSNCQYCGGVEYHQPYCPLVKIDDLEQKLTAAEAQIKALKDIDEELEELAKPTPTSAPKTSPDDLEKVREALEESKRMLFRRDIMPSYPVIKKIENALAILRTIQPSENQPGSGEHTCLDYSCCALCSMRSCDCPPESHRLIEQSKGKCRACQDCKPKSVADYGVGIEINLKPGSGEGCGE